MRRYTESVSKNIRPLIGLDSTEWLASLNLDLSSFIKALGATPRQLKVDISHRFLSSDGAKEICGSMSEIMEEFESVDALLKKLPPDDYKKLKNVLFGTETG